MSIRILPNEILDYAFSYLSPQELYDSAIVDKHWNLLINDRLDRLQNTPEKFLERLKEIATKIQIGQKLKVKASTLAKKMISPREITIKLETFPGNFLSKSPVFHPKNIVKLNVTIKEQNKTNEEFYSDSSNTTQADSAVFKYSYTSTFPKPFNEQIKQLLQPSMLTLAFSQRENPPALQYANQPAQQPVNQPAKICTPKKIITAVAVAVIAYLVFQVLYPQLESVMPQFS